MSSQLLELSRKYLIISLVLIITNILQIPLGHEVFGLQRAELLDASYGNIDDRDTLGVDGAEVGFLEETSKVAS